MLGIVPEKRFHFMCNRDAVVLHTESFTYFPITFFNEKMEISMHTSANRSDIGKERKWKYLCTHRLTEVTLEKKENGNIYSHIS